MSDFEKKVNAAVKNVTRDDNGKLVLPDDVAKDEALSYAVRAEIRRRDTQSALTEATTKAKRAEAERDQYIAGWEKDFVSKLPAEKQADLEELKATDPDKWRQELANLEAEQREKFNTKKQEIATKAQGETEAETRARLLQEYNEANPNHQINDDVLENDIPPRMAKKLESGELTFDAFLEEAGAFLQKGKVMTPGEEAPNEVDLTSTPGSDTPNIADKEAAKDVVATYEDNVF